MKNHSIHQLFLKLILFAALVFCLAITLPAQKLYVQPLDGGPQVAFALAEQPKITFNEGVMKIETQLETKNFPLNGIQNLSFTFQPTHSIVEKSVDSHIHIYPNPVTEVLSINIQMPIEHLSYRIFDLSGKSLQTGLIHSETTEISMSKFITGIYFIQISHNNQPIQSYKIIKQ